MPKILRSGSLIASDRVVPIPDAPAPPPEPPSEAALPSEAGEAPTEVEAEEQSRQILEDRTIERVQEVSQKILQSARQEREKLFEQARAEAESIREEAASSARQQVLAEKRASIESCLQEVERLMTALQSQQQSFLMQYEEGLFSLAMEIARKVVGAAIEKDASLMQALVREAVATVKNADWIGVEVSSHLSGLAESLRQELAGGQKTGMVEVTAADLPPDGCVIHTPDGIVDASVSVQLQNLQAIFEKSKQ